MNDNHESEAKQDVGWSIDKGDLRENNEDSLAAMNLSQASDDEAQSVGVYAVADGVGGHAAGDVASKLAVRTAIRQFIDEMTATDDMPENYQLWLRRAVTIANEVVYSKSQAEHKDMGTTLVMAVVVGNQAHIVNVGDSRAYIVSPEGIYQITQDHSMVNALLEAGTITHEEAENHPYKNMITQAIGVESELEEDLFTEKLNFDEYLLLCTDGLTNELSDKEIQRIILEAESSQVACENLIAATKDVGARDNIAVVVIQLRKGNT